MSKIKEVREFLIKEGFISGNNRDYRSKIYRISLESNQIKFCHICLLGLNPRSFKYDELDKFYKFVSNREKIYEKFYIKQREEYVKEMITFAGPLLKLFIECGGDKNE